MKVLVTGGGGFLGGALLKRLLDIGYDVSALGRKKYPNLPSGAELIQCDLKDKQATVNACKGMDAVFHAAAIPGVWGDSKDFFDSNVEGTRNILEGCFQAGVKKLIFTSSPSVVCHNKDMENADETTPYPDKYLCDYPLTKAIAEREVLAANNKNGLLTVSLRPHLIWGPGDPHLVPRIIDRAKKGRLARVGKGANKVDMTYVDNAVEAHILAFNHLEEGVAVAGQAYFISDDEPVNLWDWIDNLLARLDMPPVKRNISFRAANAIGATLEIIFRGLGIKSEPPMTRFVASQLSTSHYFNISKAKRDFGYKPLVTQEEGLKRLIEVMRSAS
jgi:nucleoside-diphosphate-sugar epimerase